MRERHGWTRRETLKLIGAASLASGALKGGIAMAEQGSNPPPAYRGTNEVKPLPFDPAKLRGLSEKLITSHHQNNYSGAVKRLNLIQQQFGTLPSDAAPYQMGSLKREELIATNSMLLHEAYFGNLGGAGRADGSFASEVTAAYGALDAWERDFRLTGMSLGGGSGWVVTAFDPRSGGIHNWWSFDHTHSLAGGTPVLVMDMYEHSYHMDYGANAKGYIDAFFENVKWDEVNRRLEEARKGARTT
jgi:superoxide dismutase, Fe-Mn family